MAASKVTADVRVTALRPGRRVALPDSVVAEEPLEIRVAGPDGQTGTVGITMRTPGNDFELAAGFLVTEGVVERQESVRAVRYCADVPAGEQHYNVVTVDVAVPVDLERHRRLFAVSSACGVCGSASLGALEQRCRAVGPGPRLPASLVVQLPEVLRRRQQVFDRTGGLHAAGVFDASGDALAVREDVGRHNAVDKLVGWAALSHRLPLSDHVLVVSGRVGFEIVQKAAVAGLAVIVAVSAPSSLAVETARRFGITLAGFARGDRANLYTVPDRVEGEPAAPDALAR